MKLEVTIGCSICSYNGKRIIELPFDCDTLICPKCDSENSLSILTVHDELSMFHSSDIHDKLQVV